MSSAIFTTEDTESTEARKELNALTEAVIGAAIEVHRALGPGLLESAYELCLCRELSLRGLAFEKQKAIAVQYKGVTLDCGYRADVIVGGQVLIELNSVDSLLPLHEAQLLSYLRLSGLPAGLLINFNVHLLKHGIKRRLLKSSEPFSF